MSLRRRVSWTEWRDFGGRVANFEIKICFGMGVCMMFRWRYCRRVGVRLLRLWMMRLAQCEDWRVPFGGFELLTWPTEAHCTPDHACSL